MKHLYFDSRILKYLNLLTIEGYRLQSACVVRKWVEYDLRNFIRDNKRNLMALSLTSDFAFNRIQWQKKIHVTNLKKLIAYS